MHDVHVHCPPSLPVPNHQLPPTDHQLPNRRCRIRLYTQQVVVFRYDVLKRLRRRCILPLKGGVGG